MRLVALVVPFWLAASAAAGELATAEREIVQAAERVRESVVTVLTEAKLDMDLTGVVISRGVVLTLRKPLLVRGRVPEHVRVRFPGKRKTVDTEPIDDDPFTNTILLQVKKLSTRAIQARRSADTRLGQWVMLVGNTFGAGRENTPTVSLGVVSGIVRDGDRIEAIHASTLVNPGSFGAPVVDAGGGLIGITAFKVTRSSGQSIVIPFDFIRRRYKAIGKKGARVFANKPRKRGKSSRITDLFGMVMEAAAKKAVNTVVGVRAARLESDDKPPPPEKGRPSRTKPVHGTKPAFDRSSGVIISEEGWIVCPLRITGWPRAERSLLVDLADGREFPAKVLGTDERTRLALIQIEARDLIVLEDAGRGIRSGRFALGVGFPHEKPSRATPQVTFGIVSRINALGTLHPAFQAVQTDAGVAGGNRGGALIDMDGRLIGVLLDVNDTDSRGYGGRGRGSYLGNAGLGFAVPMVVIHALAPRMAKGERLRSGFLGVSVIAAKNGLEIVTVFEKNSREAPTTAAEIGLKKGDILLAVGGMELKRVEDLRAFLAQFVVGDKLEVRYMRDGKETTATVELRER